MSSNKVLTFLFHINYSNKNYIIKIIYKSNLRIYNLLINCWLILLIFLVIPAKYIDENTIYYINPSGRFIIGGPTGDSGLTGRKIIVDTYGGWGGHGGGAFSGKDPSKVDRSAAYAVRWVAKSLVSQGFCDRAMVEVSYGIGVAHPISIYVNSYNTAKKGFTDDDLIGIVLRNFDLRPGCLIRDLRLKRPIYK